MPEPETSPTPWLDVQAPAEAQRHTLSLPERTRLERTLRRLDLPTLAQLAFEAPVPAAPMPAKKAPRQPWDLAA